MAEIFRSSRTGSFSNTSLMRPFPWGLSPNPLPAICFIEIRPIWFFQQTSSALLSGESFSSHGRY